jgi:hypothetical protein
MPQLHLILFTLLWTAVWVAPLPRLTPRVELAAGLIPFAAFGLRVFAGFFVGVPEDDAVRSAVAPLLAWVAGETGLVPYAAVLDTTVALGLVWFASAFDIPRASRVATAWIMPAAAIASLASLWTTGRPLEQTLADHLPAPVIAALAGAALAATIRWTPGPIPLPVRRRAAAVAIVTVPLAATIGGLVLRLAGDLPSERMAAAASIVALATGAAAGLTARTTGGFTRPRSRWLFALAVGVAAGATVLV